MHVETTGAGAARAGRGHEVSATLAKRTFVITLAGCLGFALAVFAFVLF